MTNKEFEKISRKSQSRRKLKEQNEEKQMISNKQRKDIQDTLD